MLFLERFGSYYATVATNSKLILVAEQITFYRILLPLATELRHSLPMLLDRDYV